ncbi:MAG: transcriptional regulator NrdR [Candidatus Woesearchaeota archaeon]
MKCPFCGYENTSVLETRDTDSGTRRRRICDKCKHRFTTYEKIESSPILVIKKDGRREPFSKEKLRNGILKACEKRPVSIEQINNICESIEAKLIEKGESEVKSKQIGDMAMAKLKSLDKIAYIRFASVYRDFADITDFEEELKKLIRKNAQR